MDRYTTEITNENIVKHEHFTSPHVPKSDRKECGVIFIKYGLNFEFLSRNYLIDKLLIPFHF